MCVEKKFQRSFKEVLGTYTPQPLVDHKCFKSECDGKVYKLTRNNNDFDEIEQIISTNLPSSAFAKQE